MTHRGDDGILTGSYGNAVDTVVTSDTVIEISLQIQHILRGKIGEIDAKIEKEVDEKIREEIQNDKASLITIFGTFASLLAFLTIEFQFLKTLENTYQIISFTLFGLLASFNLILDFITRAKLQETLTNFHKVLYGFICSFLIFGIIFTVIGGFVPTDNKQKQITELQEELKTQKTKLEQIQKQLNYYRSNYFDLN